ncbi:hypothetical protein OUZ56_006712 [Daphnia magna]|uniref:Uncharacterized protein n=1 Tax=Daphnia magna TaxID=35525 RepID=A0ABQ9YWF9_9CRUS|nr:hypothetical protein OUZ56_006712 [Daphnia magna]
MSIDKGLLIPGALDGKKEHLVLSKPHPNAIVLLVPKSRRVSMSLVSPQTSLSLLFSVCSRTLSTKAIGGMKEYRREIFGADGYRRAIYSRDVWNPLPNTHTHTLHIAYVTV